MKTTFTIILVLLFTFKIYNYIKDKNRLELLKMECNQNDITNEQIKTYKFLSDMYRDPYFPNNCVDMGKNLLIKLCLDIEEKQPKTLEDLYILTHETTDRFNDLEEVFYENGSEIETVAREAICEDFLQIATAYGFENADSEELVATRDW